MNKADYQDEAGNPAFEGYEMTNKPDILERLRARLSDDVAEEFSRDLLEAIAVIERLRAIAGAVTDGPTLAEIRNAGRKPTIAELEAILKEPDTPVRVNPDGSVTEIREARHGT